MRAPNYVVDRHGALLDGKELHFASGSNHSGEIRACALSGVNVGVAALRVNRESEAELVAWLSSSPMFRAFVDSTAFSEVDFTPEGPVLKKEIGPALWAEILHLYARLVSAAPGRVHVVAPDMPGNQLVTLERLDTWAAEINGLREMGARVIVPIQRGPLFSMEAFWLKACDVLGFEDFICGIPAKKAATDPAELGTFLEGLPPLCPPDIHLLGLGPDSTLYPEFAAVAREACPRARVWCDSVRITALVGRGTTRKDGTQSGPRKLTAARDALLAEGHIPATRVSQVKAAALARVFHEEHRAYCSAASAAGWVAE